MNKTKLTLITSILILGTFGLSSMGFSDETKAANLPYASGYESSSIQIPDWIRNNAGWWSQGQIGDSEFVSALQWLITNDIMKIPPTVQESDSSSVQIPNWIRNNAGWWSSGQIDDDSFVSVIQWLIKNGIMKVPVSTTTPTIPTDTDTSSEDFELPEIREVPWKTIEIDLGYGTLEPFVFRAYQFPGDTFQIMCQEPCDIDEELIFGSYWGIKEGHKQLMEFTGGYDAAPKFLPIDIHIKSDDACPISPNQRTVAHVRPYPNIERGAACTYDLDFQSEMKSFYPNFEMTPEYLSDYRNQNTVLHEYLHFVLAPIGGGNIQEGLIQGMSHLKIGYDGWNPETRSFIFSPNDDFCSRGYLGGDTQLLKDLCDNFGLTPAQLTESLKRQLELYRTDNSVYVNEWRLILNDILNAETKPVLLKYVRQPAFLGDEFGVGPSGGFFSLVEDTIQLKIPEGAIDNKVKITIDSMREVSFSVRFTPEIEFSKPIQVKMAYDEISFSSSETIRICKIFGNSPCNEQDIIDDAVVLDGGLVSFQTSQLGTFAFTDIRFFE